MLQNMLTAEVNLGESCSQSKSTHCLSTEMSPQAPEAKPDCLLVQTSGLSVVRPLQLASYLTQATSVPNFFAQVSFVPSMPWLTRIQYHHPLPKILRVRGFSELRIFWI